MTTIRIIDEAPFVEVTIQYRGKAYEADRFLIDTGSVATVINTDFLFPDGLPAQFDGRIRRMRGIGGWEFVLESAVDEMTTGDLNQTYFRVQLAKLDYDTSMDGILGMDFLLAVGAVIDLKGAELR